MKWSPLVMLGFGDEEGDRSLWSDLHRGHAGCIVRAALSLASAVAVIGCVVAFGGLLATGTTQNFDEIMLVAAGLAVLVWGAALYWIWSGYRRWKHTLRTVFSIVLVWGVTFPVMVIMFEFVRNEAVVAACVLLAIAASILLITISAYTHTAGRTIRNSAGAVQVHCPQCSYSLVGLSSCACPECGTAFTIDQLIGAQEYAAVKSRAREMKAEEADAQPETDNAESESAPASLLHV